MGQPVRGIHRDLQRRRVGDASAVSVRDLDALFFRQRADLRRGAVHEHHADVQRPEHGHIQQQRREIFIGHNGAVHREDKSLLAKLRNVLQDAPQVGWFHFNAE